MIATPIGWLDRPDQDARAHAGRLARDVQHERDAIGEIDIGVPALEEKRPIARGDAAIGVTRGVADAIGLGLDDAAARHAFGQYPHEHFADEKTSELGGVDGQLRPIQHARAHALSRRFHPIRSTQWRARRSGLERVGEVLGLAGHLAIEELHDAHRIGRPAVIREDELRDPEVARADDAAHPEALRVRLRDAGGLDVAPAPDALARLRVLEQLRPLGICRAQHRSHLRPMRPSGD